MTDPLSLPINDPKEVGALLSELPMAVDQARFTKFLMGFPRRYLVKTPRVDIVKHYLLLESLQKSPLALSINRPGRQWEMTLITRDRDHLFSDIAGALSCCGMNISSADAFANDEHLILDTFRFLDVENVFSDPHRVVEFQSFLENVVIDRIALETRFQARRRQALIAPHSSIEVRIDNDMHPQASHVLVDFPDHFGHLYQVSRCISDLGGNIEMAYVEINGDRIHDSFYVTHQGGKLPEEAGERLRHRLLSVGCDPNSSKTEIVLPN